MLENIIRSDPAYSANAIILAHYRQKVRTIAREALHGLLKLVETLLAQGHSCEHILEVLMPA
jgi:hypothetical protein